MSLHQTVNAQRHLDTSPRRSDGEHRAVHDESEGAKTHEGGHGHVGPLTLPSAFRDVQVMLTD